MKVNLWYDGGFTISEGGHGGNKSKDNLNQGNGKVGGWGNNARRTFVSRALYMHENSPVPTYSMLLTYRVNPKPEESKKHINAFLSWWRRRALFGFVYAVEVGKKAGLIHYHWLISSDKFNEAKNFESSKRMKLEISHAWGKIRGDITDNAVRDLRQVKHSEKAAAYITKAANYASKSAAEPENLELLKGFRLWATSYNLVGKERFQVSNENLVDLMIMNSKAKDYVLENGYAFTKYTLPREDVRSIIDTSAALQYRNDRESEEKAKRRLRAIEEKNKRQIDLFQPF